MFEFRWDIYFGNLKSTGKPLFGRKMVLRPVPAKVPVKFVRGPSGAPGGTTAGGEPRTGFCPGWSGSNFGSGLGLVKLIGQKWKLAGVFRIGVSVSTVAMIADPL